METVPVSVAPSSPVFIVSSVCVRTRGDARRGQNNVIVKQVTPVGIKGSECHHRFKAAPRGQSAAKGSECHKGVRTPTRGKSSNKG